jgi:eukaryotic-like serine/threonine-protein kinase
MDPSELLSMWHNRLPEKRRYRDFYTTLDRLIPDWPSIIRERMVVKRLMARDGASGSRMIDRLRALWNDPVYGADDFAVLVRLSHQLAIGAVTSVPPADMLAEKYEVLKHLGTGGNGDVCLVWSRETEKLYALKTIRREISDDASVRRRFRQEAELWIGLGDHPNVAKAYYYEEVRQRLYTTMAFVEPADGITGSSLACRLTGARIDLGIAFSWFCGVIDGLQHAYTSGIRAHRDLKPGNILIDRDGTAQVSDFGSASFTAAALNNSKREFVAAGTPFFMAPEQFVDSENCDQRSDIYSLGVTFYQVVTGGALPFFPQQLLTSHDTEAVIREIRDLHLSGLPKPVDSPIWPILERCLAKRPRDRFANLDEFRSALETLARKYSFAIPPRCASRTDVWTLRDQGNSLMRLGKYSQALEKLESFLRVFPDEAATLNRAVCLENLGRFAEAFAEYEKLASRNEIAGFVNGSNCLRALGRNEEAANYARNAVSIAPMDIDSWISLGNAEFSLSHWDNAMNAYRRAAEIDPLAPTPACNLAIAAERAGKNGIAANAHFTFLRLAAADDPRREYAERSLKRKHS